MSTIEEILKTAREAGASDIHLTAGIPPQMRINGRLTSMGCVKLLPADTLDIMLQIMTEAQRESFDEKGELNLSFSVPKQGRCRVNVYRQKGTVAMVLRLIPDKLPYPAELGIPELVSGLYRKRKGLIVAAGPSGGGKTSTLASVIDRINDCREAHILTLENPIEYLFHPKLSIISQREIGVDVNSYAEGIQAAMRQDADVILIGELCDRETAELAVTAAETGHLVLAAIASSGAAGAVSRLLHMFDYHQQQQFRERLSVALDTIFSQQVLPGKGGHAGVPVFEVMSADQEIRRFIKEGDIHRLTEAMQEIRNEDCLPMDETILRMYYKGRIDLETAVEYAMAPEEMQRKLTT